MEKGSDSVPTAPKTAAGATGGAENGDRSPGGEKLYPGATPLEKWVNALESGDFSQCKDYLHLSGDGYCCLGVACELYRREVSGAWEEDREEGRPIAFYPEGKGYYDLRGLPSAVQDWLGVDKANPVVSAPKTERGITSLAELNDRGDAFTFIAQVIRDQFLPAPSPVTGEEK